MTWTLRLIVSYACCPLLAFAQDSDTNQHDGAWLSQAPGSRGVATRVVISNFGGTWQDVGQGRSAPTRACAGKKVPITVQRSTSDDLEFMVWGSSVAPNCPDFSVLLKPVDETTLRGTVGADDPLTLKRQRPRSAG